MPARFSTVHQGLGTRWRLAVLLTLACELTPTLARAEDRSVSIACPQWGREDAAEIETRARAALLTSTLDARIAIDCDAEGVLVTARSVSDSATVRVTPTSATFRDEVLAAVDGALERLRPQEEPALPAPSSDASEDTPQSPTAAPVVAPTPAPALRRPHATAATLAVTAPSQPSRSYAELFGATGLEAWSGSLAGTAQLGARYAGRKARVGLRAGVARRLQQDTSFSATELSVAVEGGLEPGFAGGIRLTLSVGPSLLVVAPSTDVSALGDVTTAVLSVGADLSRPVWLGRLAVVPALGLRWFGGERGVRLDHNERFVLDGFAPSVTLGLLYRLEPFTPKN